MFVITDDAAATFDFEYRGTTYTVPTADAMSLDDAAAMANVASDGMTALTVWLRDWFERHAEGCTKDMTLKQFNSLLNAWRAASKADLGESRG